MRICMNIRSLWVAALVLAATAVGPFVSPASAQNRIGGHMGFVLPLVSHENGTTTTISDDFVIGFPVGITVRKSDKFAFDLELVPGIQNDPLHVSLTVHPGVVAGLGNGWGVGGRMAFDVNAASWGFTPILNHGLTSVGKDATLFAELVVPIRFHSNGPGDTSTSVGLGIHLGIGF
jgi:hypothetical protein